MSKIDFHCHTKYSKCSNLEPKRILKVCSKKKIQGVMICDHDTIKGVKMFKKLISENKNNTDFILISGVEILTNQGEILGAFIDEMPYSSNFPEVAEEIKEMGGMVIVPHPYDKIRRKAFKLDDDTHLEMIDAIEVFNSRCIIPNANKKALEFAEKYSKLRTAGSDAHFEVEIGKAGLIFEGTTLDEFRKQLMGGKTTYWGNRSSMMTHFHTAVHRLKRNLRKKKSKKKEIESSTIN